MSGVYKSIPVILGLFCYTTYAEAVLDAVIVSGVRAEQSELTTPASITVIARDEIEASGARHVVDVLQGRGGIQIFDTFGDGSRSSVGMRGFGETANANTLILVDGRRLNNSDISSPDLNSIALEDVERVEIVQGSAGVLFGDQAVGGVINIITRKPGALRHSIKLSAGSYDTVDFHGVTSQALDNGINYRVSLDMRESDNYRRHNEVSYLNGFGKLGYEYNGGSVFAELQYIDDELNTPGALFENEVAVDRRQVAPTYVGDFSNLETTVGRWGLVQEINDNWSFEGEMTNRDTDGEFRISFVSSGPATENATQDRKVFEITPRAIGYIPSWNNTMVTLGVDAIKSDYEISSVIGDQSNDQTQHSLYAQAVIPATQRLDVTVGVRYAEVDNELSDTFTFDNEKIEDDITVGTFGIAYRPNDTWRLLLRADQNYRFVKVEEYAGAQPFFSPPPSPIILETQEGVSLETGIEWIGGRNRAKFLIYQLELDNELAFDPIIFLNINLDETERNGAIAEGRWQVNDKLGVIMSYTFTDAEITDGTSKGNDIPLVAEHSGMISGDYQLSSRLQLYAEIQAKSDRAFSGDFDNVLERLSGYGVTNIKVEYALKDFIFSGRVNNVFDKEYTDVGFLGFDSSFSLAETFFPSPERNIYVTASWKFK